MYPCRILYLRCIYFVYFALVVCWTCNWSLWLVFIALHVRMSIYLLNVHCSYSLMTDLVWSRYAYMFYSVYKLDRTLLAHVRTMYSTCHKLNESFVYVWVFQVTGIYVQVLHSFKIRCEWVLPLFPNSHLSLESVLGVLSWNSLKERLQSYNLQLSVLLALIVCQIWL